MKVSIDIIIFNAWQFQNQCQEIERNRNMGTEFITTLNLLNTITVFTIVYNNFIRL